MIFTGLCFTTEITLLSEREREREKKQMHLSQPLSDKNYMQSAGTKTPLTLMTTSQLPRLPSQIKYKSHTTTFSLKSCQPFFFKMGAESKYIPSWKLFTFFFFLFVLFSGRETGNFLTRNVHERQNEELQLP